MCMFHHYQEAKSHHFEVNQFFDFLIKISSAFFPILQTGQAELSSADTPLRSVPITTETILSVNAPDSRNKH